MYSSINYWNCFLTKEILFIWWACILFGDTKLRNPDALNNNINAPDKYKVGENVLIQLDMNGNDIKGDLALRYRLQKIK